MSPPNQGLENKISDLNMLVNMSGMERTHEEFDSLLAEAGVRLARIVETASPPSWGGTSGTSAACIARQLVRRLGLRPRRFLLVGRGGGNLRHLEARRERAAAAVR